MVHSGAADWLPLGWEDSVYEGWVDQTFSSLEHWEREADKMIAFSLQIKKKVMLINTKKPQSLHHIADFEWLPTFFDMSWANSFPPP